MCGIVGGIAQRNVVPILIEGLKRLEYRGYDSAGLAVVHNDNVYRKRELGKVKGLESLINYLWVMNLPQKQTQKPLCMKFITPEKQRAAY